MDILTYLTINKNFRYEDDNFQADGNTVWEKEELTNLSGNLYLKQSDEQILSIGSFTYYPLEEHHRVSFFEVPAEYLDQAVVAFRALVQKIEESAASEPEE